MPWRLTKDPYHIWLSEIILQQTQVVQGTPYFNKFIKRFPDLKALANAQEEEVLKLWQGLGYYSRARNLLFTAKYIQNELNGVFPNTYHGLLQLKGVGDYTAAAIASICFNEVVPVIDGNVTRVLSRLFLINENYLGSKSKENYRLFANKLLDKNAPGDSNQAIMELGALMCKPNKPNCLECPLNAICLANKNQKIALYPPKKMPIKRVEVYMHFLVPIYKNRLTLIKKRSHPGIWKNLFVFTGFESEQRIEETYVPQALLKMDPNLKVKFRKPINIKHILSHRIINARFYILNIEQEDDWDSIRTLDIEKYFRSIDENSLIIDKQKFNRTKKCDIFEVELNEMTEHYAIPRLITKFLELANIPD